MKNKVQIYVMTHKPFTRPADPIYVPVHVGRSAWLTAHPGEESELLAYVGDDSGDNISDQNCYYSELTGNVLGMEEFRCGLHRNLSLPTVSARS